MDPIGLGNEMESKLDVVPLAELGDRLGRERTVGVIDLMEKIDSVRSPANAPNEFAPGLIDPPKPWHDEQQPSLDFSRQSRSILSAREAGRLVVSGVVVGRGHGLGSLGFGVVTFDS